MSAARPDARYHDPIYGCELVEHVDADGYGRVRGKLAHVVAWERAYGPVPDDKELDHLCRRRNCCALAHLELASRSEQERRKLWKVRAKRAKCPQGHDMNINAMTTPEGGRVCRTCSRS